MSNETLVLTIELPISIDLLGPVLTALSNIDGMNTQATSEGLDSELVIEISRKE
jgi:hypothetical protein